MNISEYTSALITDASNKQIRLERAISELEESQDQDILKSMVPYRSFLRGQLAAYREVAGWICGDESTNA